MQKLVNVLTEEHAVVYKHFDPVAEEDYDPTANGGEGNAVEVQERLLKEEREEREQYLDLQENVEDTCAVWGDLSIHGPILAAAYNRPIVYVGITPWQSTGNRGGAFIRYSGDDQVSARADYLCRDYSTEAAPNQSFEDYALGRLRQHHTPETIYMIHGHSQTHYNLVDFRPPAPARA